MNRRFVAFHTARPVVRRFIFWLVLCATSCSASAQPPAVRTGADILLHDSLSSLRAGRIAVVCNRSSVLSDGRHLLDALQNAGAVRVVSIFTPEHGFGADASAGETQTGGMNSGVPVISLYGRQRKPSRAQLAELDALVFDLQDVGSRFYTYLSTMILCMEAAADARVPFIVLDRPNPVNGITVEGPVLHREETGFLGMLPIPVRHGMTMGELAMLAEGERWFNGAAELDLHVIRMQGWQRRFWFDETGLPWRPPSPNIPDPATALAYPATCWFEGTNLSEGRGTDSPFFVFGAPFVRVERVLARLRRIALPGVRFESVTFVPRSVPGARQPKHEGAECHGLRMRIVDRSAFRAVRTGIHLLTTIHATCPRVITITPHLDLLLGAANTRRILMPRQSVDRVVATWEEEARVFKRMRAKYLLY
jgi:uncharacterized protein YbbC (DUF1343 family)